MCRMWVAPLEHIVACLTKQPADVPRSRTCNWLCQGGPCRQVELGVRAALYKIHAATEAGSPACGCETQDKDKDASRLGNRQAVVIANQCNKHLNKFGHCHLKRKDT